VIDPDRRERSRSLPVDEPAELVEHRECPITGDSVGAEVGTVEEDERHRFHRCDGDPGDAPGGFGHDRVIADRSSFGDHGPMTTWIALLRGINVGGNRRVPMAELRAALEAIGLDDVRTYIVSGNVVFRSRRSDAVALTQEIEAAIERRFGFPVAVVLRTASEMRQVVDRDPLPDGSAADPAHRYAIFLSADPAPGRLAAIDARAVDPDVFVAGDRVIHAWYRGGLQASKLAGHLTDRGLGVTATARNWNTVCKLVELAGDG